MSQQRVGERGIILGNCTQFMQDENSDGMMGAWSDSVEMNHGDPRSHAFKTL